jgi:hypothetical protein
MIDPDLDEPDLDNSAINPLNKSMELVTVETAPETLSALMSTVADVSHYIQTR